MARPGLEPGTPRFSVVRSSLSNARESLQSESIQELGEQVESPQIPSDSSRFGRRQAPRLPMSGFRLTPRSTVRPGSPIQIDDTSGIRRFCVLRVVRTLAGTASAPRHSAVGGSSPHTSSIGRSAGTSAFARTRGCAGTALFAAARRERPLSLATSSGSSNRNSTMPNLQAGAARREAATPALPSASRRR
jgi:hypothetical protein